jgi:hypothetical protein
MSHAGRSHGLGDQADHGCRGNQNRIADLQRPEIGSETIRRRRYALAQRALIEWSGRATLSHAASGRDWFPPVKRLEPALQAARSFDLPTDLGRLSASPLLTNF